MAYHGTFKLAAWSPAPYMGKWCLLAYRYTKRTVYLFRAVNEDGGVILFDTEPEAKAYAKSL